MATRIRLRRVGRKKQASFRIVVAGAIHSNSGRITETIGKYNPRTAPSFLEIDEKRALYWLRQGAQMTESVESLFRQGGILKKLADGAEGQGVVSIGNVDGTTQHRAGSAQKPAEERPQPAAAEPKAGTAKTAEEAKAAESEAAAEPEVEEPKATADEAAKAEETGEAESAGDEEKQGEES